MHDESFASRVTDYVFRQKFIKENREHWETIYPNLLGSLESVERDILYARRFPVLRSDLVRLESLRLAHLELLRGFNMQLTAVLFGQARPHEFPGFREAFIAIYRSTSNQKEKAKVQVVLKRILEEIGQKRPFTHSVDARKYIHYKDLLEAIQE